MSLAEKVNRMSDAAAILRDTYSPHAAKKIARTFDVSIATAKVWLAGRFPEERTMQLKSAVDAELCRIEARNTEIRKQLGLEGRRSGGSDSTDDQTHRGSDVGTGREDRAPAVGLRGAMR